MIEVHQIGNLDLLSSLFEKHGNSIAGVITEFPTNPLLQAGDLEKARCLCDQADALLVVDPTMVSPKNAGTRGQTLSPGSCCFHDKPSGSVCR